MEQHYSKLTRAKMKALTPGESICQGGVIYEKLAHGDGRFSVNIMVDGQRIHRVIGKVSEGASIDAVKDFIATTRTDVRNDRLNLPTGRKSVVLLTPALELYQERLTAEGGRDIDAKIRRLKQHVCRVLGNPPISKISSFDLERFKKTRRDEGAAPATVNRELAAFSHMLNKLVDWGVIIKKPCKVSLFKEEHSRISYLTVDQIKRVITAARQDQNPYIYPFILIGLGTSMRRMEILSIKVADIDVSRGRIFIPVAKAGRREQPMTGALADYLRDYVGRLPKGQEWLFPSIGAATGHAMNIEKPFRRVVANAGLDPKVITRHTLRHTAITQIVQAGVDLPTVQRFSGHKSISMVLRYSHQNGSHIEAAMDILESRYGLGELIA